VPDTPQGSELTESQRAYLAAFEEWLFDRTEQAYRKRRQTLLLLLSEAGVKPEYRGPRRRKELDKTVWLRDLVALLEETEPFDGSRLKRR